MRVFIILVILSLPPLSSAVSEDYYHEREIFVLAGPMDEFDEGDAPGQYGGGIAYHFFPRLGTEFYYSRGSVQRARQYSSDPETGDPGYVSRWSETVQIFGGRMLVHFTKGRLKPYMGFGVASAMIHIKGRDRNFGEGPEEIFFDETDTRVGFDCNTGIKYYFNPTFSIRSEVGSILMERSLVKLTFLVSYHF